MKTCYRCKETKPVEEFNKSRRIKDGLRSYCKICDVDHVRKWREGHPKKHKSTVLKRLYGLELEDFEQIKLNQQNCCAACHTEFSETPSIDHCHITGKIRGLLCPRCNMALGLLDDSPERLRAAANYLDKVK